MQSLAASLKQAVLASARVPANFALAAPAAAAAPCLQFWRGLAADASYLDKQQVTDRVLSVVKNFEKVEEGKVSPWAARGGFGGRQGPAPPPGPSPRV